MLRISFACALLATSAPAAQATLGKFFNKTGNAEEAAEDTNLPKLNKLDLSTLKLDNLRLDGLNAENSSFPDFKLDLPSLNLGLGQSPLPGQDLDSPPVGKNLLKVDLQELKELAGALPQAAPGASAEANAGIRVNLQDLKEQLGQSFSQLISKLPVGGNDAAEVQDLKQQLTEAFPQLLAKLPVPVGGDDAVELQDSKQQLSQLLAQLKLPVGSTDAVDLQGLKQQLTQSLPQLIPKLFNGGNGETAPFPPSVFEAPLANGNLEMPSFAKDGEALQRLGQLLKQKDQLQILSALSIAGKKQERDADAAGPQREKETADAGESLRENDQAAATQSLFGDFYKSFFSGSKPKIQVLSGMFDEHKLSLPELATKGLKFLRFAKPADAEGDGASHSEAGNSTDNEGLDANATADVPEAPARRLTILPTLSDALGFRIRRDEEILNAFERGVKKLQFETKNDLASTLETRLRPVELVSVERLLAKVGLNGLGGPAPIDLSFSERAIMEQARRKRTEVERIKAKYERSIRYLVEELEDSLKGAHKYRQRISDVINDKMYTQSAMLSA